MSARSFTVFIDAPVVVASKSDTSDYATIKSTSGLLESRTASSVHVPSTTEKENLHPLTGERAAPSVGKKRKNSVLSVKAPTPLATKKQKDLKEGRPDAKKRKSTALAKAKASAKKDVKSSGSGKRRSPRKPSALSTLPSVEEVAEEERGRLSQAEIDSKCYDLTVQPLADVSRAYDHSPIPDDLSNENVKSRPAKESSAEPELRDYFAPSLSSSTSASVKNNIPIDYTLEQTKDTKSFSTPERKRIYAAFTFSSPSPSAERFSKSTLSGNIPRLQLTTPKLPTPSP